MQDATLPKAPPTLAQERLGIAAVALVAAKKNLIWRESPAADVGVDGHLEFVDAANRATGRLVGVQVKSGPSFFQNESDAAWHFYPEPKHRGYWERYPLPVLLVLHSPRDDLSYWVDARQALRSPEQSSKAYIAVPKANILQSTEPERLFKTTGVSADSFIEDVGRVLNLLLQTRSQNGSFPVSWFELFTYGLTNLCRSLYFGIDLALSAAEFNLASEGSEFGVGVGPQEHQFLFAYVKFLVTQHLAEINYADYLIDWEDRLLQPKFVAPLTSRGRQLKQMISDEEDRLVAGGALKTAGGSRVAQEGDFEMVEYTYRRRMARIRKFQEVAKVRFVKN